MQENSSEELSMELTVEDLKNIVVLLNVAQSSNAIPNDEDKQVLFNICTKIRLFLCSINEDLTYTKNL